MIFYHLSVLEPTNARFSFSLAGYCLLDSAALKLYMKFVIASNSFSRSLMYKDIVEQYAGLAG